MNIRQIRSLHGKKCNLPNLKCTKQTVSQPSPVEQDAPVQADEGHRPPLLEGQAWQVHEQLKEGDAGKKRSNLKEKVTTKS